MATFKIDPRSNKKAGGELEIFTIEADNHGLAAQIAANTIFKSKNLVALRQTGDANGSGMFQAYEKMGSMLNSRGNMFHVTLL